MAPASAHDAPWAVLVARAVPALAFALIVIVRRPPMRALRTKRAAGAVVASAGLGSASIGMYAIATQNGPLAIVSVLASLYPAVTVLLAYQVLGERVRRTQQTGIGILLAAVVLIAAG